MAPRIAAPPRAPRRAATPSHRRSATCRASRTPCAAPPASAARTAARAPARSCHMLKPPRSRHTRQSADCRTPAAAARHRRSARRRRRRVQGRLSPSWLASCSVAAARVHTRHCCNAPPIACAAAVRARKIRPRGGLLQSKSGLLTPQALACLTPTSSAEYMHVEAYVHICAHLQPGGAAKRPRAHKCGTVHPPAAPRAQHGAAIAAKPCEAAPLHVARACSSVTRPGEQVVSHLVWARAGARAALLTTP